jgi:hypothetical protein
MIYLRIHLNLDFDLMLDQGPNNVIKDFITRGITTLPLERNLIPSMRAGGGKEMMKDAFTVEKGGYRQHWTEELGLPRSFSFCVWATQWFVELDNGASTNVLDGKESGWHRPSEQELPN